MECLEFDIMLFVIQQADLGLEKVWVKDFFQFFCGEVLSFVKNINDGSKKLDGKRYYVRYVKDKSNNIGEHLGLQV